MKALDTSVLLSLLEGDGSAKALLRRLRGVEVATTELNLLELALLSSMGDPRRRAARAKALDRLRTRLTVLPIDQGGTRESTARLSAGGSRSLPILPLAALGAFEQYACDELFTSNPTEVTGRWRFRITKFPIKSPKSRN